MGLRREHIATLFPNVARTDAAPARDDEDLWPFLNRVDTPAFDRVRDALNAWFARFPAEHRAHIVGRMRSGSSIDFHSAWFELYLHELHRQLGFDVIVEPELADVTTRPDFVIGHGSDAFYMEATIVGNRQAEGRDRRIAAVTAAINRIDSPDFSLEFEIEREGPDSPAMGKVRKRTQAWLRSLDWQEERAKQERAFDLDALPARTDEAGSWSFTFWAWPRRPADRGRGRPAIDIYPSDGGIFDHAGPLRRRLEEKAGKYGTPQHGVVIAVRLDHLGADNDDVRVALFGPSIGRLDPSDRRRTVDTGRHGPGLFRTEDGRWRNQHVAGVLVWDLELRFHSVARRTPRLWLHPDANFRLPASLPWTTVESRDGQFYEAAGSFEPARVPELPGLAEFAEPRDWPGELFPAAA